MSATPVDPTCRQITVSVSAHAAMIGSHQPEKIDGMPMRCGCSGSVTAREAARRVAADLGGAELGVGEERDAHRDDAVGVRRVPLVEEPVVPRLRHREPELGVGAAREHRAAEAGDLRREVHRRPHAVDVHVADAGVDVVATGPHLVEAGRLDLPVLALAADDRVQPDLEEDLAVELPDLVALVGLDDLRREVLRACAGSRPSNMSGGSTRWSSTEMSV